MHFLENRKNKTQVIHCFFSQGKTTYFQQIGRFINTNTMRPGKWKIIQIISLQYCPVSQHQVAPISNNEYTGPLLLSEIQKLCVLSLHINKSECAIRIKCDWQIRNLSAQISWRWICNSHQWISGRSNCIMLGKKKSDTAFGRQEFYDSLRCSWIQLCCPLLQKLSSATLK